jgi:hypothetical protein
MTDNKIKILFFEDNPADYDLLVEKLPLRCLGVGI